MEQRGGKIKSKKREKGPKDIDKKEGGISGGFFYERSQSSPFYDKTIKQYLELDPVGSTVRYEMMKLCPRSV